MEYKNVIGIDVSKLTLDLCLLTYEGECEFYQCANNGKEIISLLNTVFSSHDLTKEHTLLCAEYTGHYGNRLTEVALLNDYQFWLENPAQIKNSQGVQRGKDDRKDAERIACYAKDLLTERYYRSLYHQFTLNWLIYAPNVTYY